MYRTAQQLFNRRRGSSGSRQLCKNLRETGFNVRRYRTRT
jgi:Holliday junction resolvase